MKTFKSILKLLGTIWLLPAVVLVWLFYILPFWALGAIKFSHWADFLIPIFYVNPDSKLKWYAKAWRDWAGFSAANVIILRIDYLNHERTIKHELQHCYQQWAFGVLFYPIYFLSSVFIWLFILHKHSYHDNPFERNARKVAGQRVDIPRKYWMHGEDDRWSWW